MLEVLIWPRMGGYGASRLDVFVYAFFLDWTCRRILATGIRLNKDLSIAFPRSFNGQDFMLVDSYMH